MAAAGQKVGRALDLPTGQFAIQLVEAVDAIDRVHGDGTLPYLSVKLQAPANPRSDGEYHWEGPIRAWIAVRPGCHHTGTVLLHEGGQFLDHLGLGSDMGLSSELGDLALEPWRQAVKASRANRALSETVATGKAKLVLASGKEIPFPGPVDFAKYLLEPGEVWARCYAQFVAIRSGSLALVAGIDAGCERRSGKRFARANGTTMTSSRSRRRLNASSGGRDGSPNRRANGATKAGGLRRARPPHHGPDGGRRGRGRVYRLHRAW